MQTESLPEAVLSRRRFIHRCLLGGGLLGLGGASAGVAGRAGAGDLVWQLDPDKCIKCGNCATECVLEPSAVKCVHAFAICGNCDLCFGYFDPDHVKRDSGGENQLCPVGAIKRTFIEDPYYEYTIDETLCIGCGKCVEGCEKGGNGSLLLQVRHDRCLNCNECSIAVSCPADAYTRIPASQAYLLKGRERTP